MEMNTVKPASTQQLSGSDQNEQSLMGLATIVQDHLRQYFEEIGESSPSDLYALLLCQVEPSLLGVVINRTNNNQSKMARWLGISRGTLRKKLFQYGLLKTN